ncbi:MAG: efflux transporter outer membrane subunit [Pseudomonadota bacterium]
MNTMKQIALASATLIMLTACQSAPSADRASLDTAIAIRDLPEAFASSPAQNVKVANGWIGTFGDPVLSGLVAEAQVRNPSVQILRANVAEARALSRQARSARFPQVTASLAADRSGTQDSRPVSALSLGLDVAWEADVWGRLSSQQSAAQASLGALEADLTGAQNLLAAQVASAYALAIELAHQEEILAQVVASLEEIQRIVLAREDAGLASRQDVALATADLANAQESLKDIQGARRQALRSLELLIGRFPKAEADVAAEMPTIPNEPATGLPSELLERRPDLIAAERRIAAAADSLDLAKAAKLPSLQLSSSVGGASNALQDVLSPSNLAWRTGSALLAPLFTAGRLQAEQVAAEARLDASVQAYLQTALTAFSEVEGALDQRAIIDARLSDATLAAKSNQEAFDIAVARFDVGETDLLDVLTIQQRLLQSQSGVATLRRTQIDQFIALSLALGGEWS